VQELQRAVQLANQSTETLAALATAYAAAGQHGKAQSLAAQLEASRSTRFVLPYNFAKIYVADNRVEKAFEWPEKAYDDGSPDLIELNSEPIFDGIRNDVRFTGLMRRIGWQV